MRKKLLSIILASSLSVSMLYVTPIYAEAVTEESTTEGQPIFKSFFWGDSRDTIMAVEGKNPDMSGEMTGLNAEYIVYKTTVAGLDAYIAYYFCDKGLFTIKYLLNEDHSTESFYLDDVDTLISGVSAKYGDPDLDYDNWDTTSHKEYYKGREGTALLYGYLKRQIYWKLDDLDTFISISSSADNYSITTSLQYESLSISAEKTNYASDF